MSDEHLGDWKPTTKVNFSDEEIIVALRKTIDKPNERTGNLWAFFRGLPRPEQQRLENEARRGSK
jgi:hypothetical protein